MTEVQFDEPQYTRTGASSSDRSFLTKTVINMGLAKDDAGAQKVLIVVLVVVIILTILVQVVG